MEFKNFNEFYDYAIKLNQLDINKNQSLIKIEYIFIIKAVLKLENF